MANPTTVWTALAMPNPASGSIPFVDTDNTSIITDVLNFFYTSKNATLVGTALVGQLTLGGGVRFPYTDTSAAPGVAPTINKPSGRVAINAAATSVVVTNSCCFASSIVLVQLETADATLTRVIVTPANGSFTITGNAAATGVTKMSFTIINVQ